MIRNALAICWTILVLSVLLIASGFSINHAARKAKLGARISQLWAKGILHIYKVKVQHKGALPPMGSFVISNHISWLDILILASLYPSNFVAKLELSQSPLVGFLCRCGGAIFINRNRQQDTPRVIKTLQTYLNSGCTISLFPEGWCADGKQLKPFKKSLFEAPAINQSPCIPVFIHYNRNEVAWVDESKILHHAMRLFKKGPVSAIAYFGEKQKNPDRRALATACENAIGDMFKPI